VPSPEIYSQYIDCQFFINSYRRFQNRKQAARTKWFSGAFGPG
jgi:hypothetical protein